MLAAVAFFVLVAGVHQPAQAASGCSPQTQPGDHLDCSLGGPYGPGAFPGSGLNCMAECKALKNCLNTTTVKPASNGCVNQQNSLNLCVANARRAIKMSYSPTLGCYATVEFLPETTFAISPGPVSIADGVDSGTADNGAGSGSLPQQFSFIEFVKLVTSIPGNENEWQYCSSGGLPDPSLPSILMSSIIGAILDVPESAIVAEANFVEDLGASAFELAQIASEFEWVYGIEIDDSVVFNIETVGDMTGCVNEAFPPGI